jgi:proteasome accessory factor C
MAAADHLARLLFIVPYAMDRDGVPVSELAQLLDVTAQQIVADVALLCMVGQPPLTPDHLLDLYIEDDVVFVDLDQSLSRPLRLTHEEARALVLGVKWLGDLGGMGQQLQPVLAQLTQGLNAADRHAVDALSACICVVPEAQSCREHGLILRRAIAECCSVEAVYYSASSDEKKHYLLKPLALVAHGGTAYMVARDAGAEDKEKLFRLDRLQNVIMSGPTFVPGDVDLERFRTPRLYFGSDTLQARVRLGQNSWRQVADHFGADDVVAREDGGVQLHLPTQSLAWLSRWCLQFGLDAEILAPAAARDHVANLCAEAHAVYAQKPRHVAPLP